MLYISSQRTAIITTNWAFLSEYFTGVETDNPSGNKNIKSISFFDNDDNLKHKIEFTYDVDDDILIERSL